MKNVLLIILFVFNFFFLEWNPLYSRNIISSWEAEDFIGIGFKPDNNNYPLIRSEAHSGGWYVTRISQSNSVSYYVYVEEEGTYELDIHYMVKEKGGQIGNTIGVRVNNQIIRGLQITEYTDADDSLNPAIASLLVYLDAGINLIRIGQNGGFIADSGYCPNMDKFELYTSDEEIEKPETDENYQELLGTFSGLDSYSVLPELFEVNADSNNPTLSNLFDGSTDTKFISEADREIITIHFSKGSGFALRSLILDNPYVLFSHEIQRSEDGTENSWEKWIGVNQFYRNTGSFTGDYGTTGNQEYNYKYYRITLIKPDWMDKMEISELKINGLYLGLADLTNDENGVVSTTNTQIDGNNGVHHAINDDPTLKFSAQAATLDVLYTFNNYAKVTAYSIANAFSPSSRDPKSWILEASMDNEDFIELDKVEGFTWFFDRRCQEVRKIENPGIYKYYRLTVIEKQGASESYIHIGEFQLFGELYDELPPDPVLISSWEAEDFIGMGFKPDNNNYPIIRSGIHSGGGYITHISQSNSVFYYLYVEEEGTYDLKIHYMVKEKGGQIGNTIGVRVNDQVIRGLQISEYTETDDSVETAIASYPVYLGAGINLLRIGENGAFIEGSGYCPNIDRFELFTSNEKMEKPIEDEEYDSSLKIFVGLDSYSALPEFFELTCESGNATISALTDGQEDTRFISENEMETLILYFPEGTGFALRNLVIDNEYVLFDYTVQRSKDGTDGSWENWDGVKVFFANTGSCLGDTGDGNQEYDYRYYKVTLIKPEWLEKMEIGEMKIYGIYQGLEDLTSLENGFVFTSNEEFDGENNEKNAINNDVTKKFSVKGTFLDVIFKFNERAKVSAYNIANAFSPGARDPKSWILEASNDSVDFVELDRVENYSWYIDRRCQDVRKINTEEGYKYYRLNVYENQNASDPYMHIGEFQLFGEIIPDLVVNIDEAYRETEVQVYASGNTIIMENIPGKLFEYTINSVSGQTFKTGSSVSHKEEIKVMPGIYIITIKTSVGFKNVKVILN